MLLFNHKQRFVFDFQYYADEWWNQKKPYKWNERRWANEWTNVEYYKNHVMIWQCDVQVFASQIRLLMKMYTGDTTSRISEKWMDEEREKKKQSNCVDFGFVLDAQRFIFIYCWCYLCEIISMLDWWTVPRPLNSSVVLSPPIAWLCGDRKYRWQINVNDNNNSEMDQNSQAKKKQHKHHE